MPRSDRLAAALLTLFAAALRFYNLGEWSFWTDEIYTLRDAAQFPQSLTLNPIPYAAAAFTTSLFGVSEWSARLGPALVGTASVPLVFRFGRDLLGRRAAFAAALFTAASPWHIYWSQNARHYAFAFFFALLAAWSFHAYVESGGRLRFLAALASALCLTLSHSPAAALTIGFAAYALLRWTLRRRIPPPPRLLRRSLWYFAPFALAALAVLAIPDLRSSLFSGWGRNMWSRSPFYIAAAFAYGLTLPVCAAPLFTLRKTLSSAPLLFLWCALAAPSAFFLAASLFQNIAGYYLFFLTPFALLLAGFAARRSRLAAAALLAASLFQTALYFGPENGGRPDWRRALTETAQNAEPNSVLYFHTPELGAHYADEAEIRWEKIGLQRVQTPDAAPWAERSVVVWDAKWASAVDPNGAFLRWLDANGRRIARVPAYARASDRAVEAFQLNPR